jgi:hypothetical protein
MTKPRTCSRTQLDAVRVIAKFTAASIPTMMAEPYVHRAAAVLAESNPETSFRVSDLCTARRYSAATCSSITRTANAALPLKKIAVAANAPFVSPCAIA